MNDNRTKFFSNKNNVIGLSVLMYVIILYICITILSVGQSILLIACILILNNINYVMGMKVNNSILEKGYEYLKKLEVERRRKKMKKDKNARNKE